MVFKKIALISAMLTLLLAGAATWCQQPRKKICIMAWDLHDVVFKHNKRGMLAKLRNAPWRKLIFNCNGDTWKKNFKIIPAYFKVAVTQAPGAGDQYYVVAENLNYAELQEYILEMTTELHPMQDTVDFIKNNQQIKHYIASNMGKHALEKVMLKFPDVFKGTFGLEHSTLATYSATECCKKPSKEFFDMLVANVPGDQHILFIDDNAKNVKAANAHPSGRITGIQFTGPETLQMIAATYDLQVNPDECWQNESSTNTSAPVETIVVTAE